MSGETIVTVEADQVVVVTETVPPPGVADVALALAAASAQADVATAQAALAAAYVGLAGMTFDGGAPSSTYTGTAIDGGTP